MTVPKVENLTVWFLDVLCCTVQGTEIPAHDNIQSRYILRRANVGCQINVVNAQAKQKYVF